MGEIINLRRARKVRARDAAIAQAAANRAMHGQTKAARAGNEAERWRREALLDGAVRVREPDDS